MSSYEDYVRCDVIPMTITHILLGQPWLYDRNVKKYQGSDTFILPWGRRKVRVHSLPSKLSCTPSLSAGTACFEVTREVQVPHSDACATTATVEPEILTYNVENDQMKEDCMTKSDDAVSEAAKEDNVD